MANPPTEGGPGGIFGVIFERGFETSMVEIKIRSQVVRLKTSQTELDEIEAETLLRAQALIDEISQIRNIQDPLHLVLLALLEQTGRLVTAQKTANQVFNQWKQASEKVTSLIENSNQESENRVVPVVREK